MFYYYSNFSPSDYTNQSDAKFGFGDFVSFEVGSFTCAEK